jgi:hypothetical protein
MDLTFAIVCIGPTEPTFVAALVLGLLAAIVAWRALARLGASVTDPWRRRLYLPPVWAIALFVLLFGPRLLLDVLYPLLHSHARVCTHFVYRAFYLPPLLLAILPVARRLRQWTALRRARRQAMLAMRPRAWASIVLGLGMLCLTPLAIVMWLYYSRLWEGIDPQDPSGRAPAHLWSALPPGLVHASIVGGPLLIVVGAILILVRGTAFRDAVRMVRAGSILLSLWSVLGLVTWSPGLEGQIVVGVMALASLFLAITAWRRREEGRA